MKHDLFRKYTQLILGSATLKMQKPRYIAFHAEILTIWDSEFFHPYLSSLHCVVCIGLHMWYVCIIYREHWRKMPHINTEMLDSRQILVSLLVLAS